MPKSLVRVDGDLWHAVPLINVHGESGAFDVVDVPFLPRRGDEITDSYNRTWLVRQLSFKHQDGCITAYVEKA